jgi:hypothetical protein
MPDYQQLPLALFPNYYTGNGGSSTYRNVPDVAADADPFTGVGIYIKDEGGWVQYGGTSLSCPIWAGFPSNVSAAPAAAGLRRDRLRRNANDDRMILRTIQAQLKILGNCREILVVPFVCSLCLCGAISLPDEI